MLLSIATVIIEASTTTLLFVNFIKFFFGDKVQISYDRLPKTEWTKFIARIDNEPITFSTIRLVRHRDNRIALIFQLEDVKIDDFDRLQYEFYESKDVGREYP